MKYRYRTAIEIFIEADNDEQAQDKFGDIDIGALDAEQKATRIEGWDFIDVECINKINPDGSIGEEV